MDNDLETMARSDTGAISVHAGFPNPAFGGDRSQTTTGRSGATVLSLDRLLVKNPSSTYFFRIRGDTWAEVGIFDGDIAIIDRALSPQRSDLVVNWQGQQFRLQHFRHWRQDTEPWGVVSSVIHRYAKSE